MTAPAPIIIGKGRDGSPIVLGLPPIFGRHSAVCNKCGNVELGFIVTQILGFPIWLALAIGPLVAVDAISRGWNYVLASVVGILTIWVAAVAVFAIENITKWAIQDAKSKQDNLP